MKVIPLGIVGDRKKKKIRIANIQDLLILR